MKYAVCILQHVFIFSRWVSTCVQSLTKIFKVRSDMFVKHIADVNVCQTHLSVVSQSSSPSPFCLSHMNSNLLHSVRASLLSHVTEQWNWQEASCLPVCLSLNYSLLLPPPSVITSSSAHKLTIRWGQRHKHSTTSSHVSMTFWIPHSPTPQPHNPHESCRLMGGVLHFRGATACGPISHLGLGMLHFVSYH